MARTFLAVLLISLILASASVQAGQGDSGNIIVMPVEPADKSLADGAKVLREIIIDYFKNNHSVTVIAEEQKEAMAGSDTGGRLEMIRSITGKLDSNRALLISLTRYRERVGDEYSIEDPASLAFEFKLLNVEEGRTICSGRFDETQQPLTENILKLPQVMKRDFKWITVRKMAVEAVQDKFDSCPDLQYTPGE